MTRTNASQQPALYDLTLYGSSTSYGGDLFLDEGWPYETEDWLFQAGVTGPEPVTYQWEVKHRWSSQWEVLDGQTNYSLLWTNADLWENGSLVGLSVTNAAGETLWLGPATLWVLAKSMRLPAPTNISGLGPAERYPATINVRGAPSNGLVSVKIVLNYLNHSRPSDLDLLVVSPTGTNIILMSQSGANVGVTNSTFVFYQQASLPPAYPDFFPSGQTLIYRPCNYGQRTALPGAPAGPYSTNLDDLVGQNPNGLWKLFIYDGQQSGAGQLLGSWWLDFTFQ
jgi:subtilisin-like proprotein convertase family protein